MPEDMIRYDILVQEALRGVMRKVMTEVVQAGLPGDHHFYIAFSTGGPGVRVSQRLRQRYPDEMTIVLQHQFRDLVVNEQGFEVTLSFGGVAERLEVPFSAVKGFFDPSVQFGLQFEPESTDEEEDEDAEAGADDGEETPALQPTPITGLARMPTVPPRDADAPAKDALEGEGEAPGAQVLSLDAFRKKP